MLPSPKKKLNFFEKNLPLEVIAGGVSLVGLVVQLVLVALKPDSPTVRDLAKALISKDKADLLKLVEPTHLNWIALVFRWVPATLLLAGTAVLIVIRIKRAKYQDKELAELLNPEGLRGCLTVLYAVLEKKIPAIAEDGKELRLTLYGLPEENLDDPEELEQTVDYIGENEPGKAGRRLSVHAGVIGLCYRTGEAITAKVTSSEGDQEGYIDEIVRNWGYKYEQAKSMKMDRKCFIAVPIKGDQGKVIGILYGDSNIPDAFDNVSAEFVATAIGIATYISERYPNGK